MTYFYITINFKLPYKVIGFIIYAYIIIYAYALLYYNLSSFLTALP